MQYRVKVKYVHFYLTAVNLPVVLFCEITSGIINRFSIFHSHCQLKLILPKKTFELARNERHQAEQELGD